MSVQVSGGRSGSQPVTSFADTFIRASGPVASRDWVEVTYWWGGSGANRRTNARIGAVGGDQGLILGNSGINNPTVGSGEFLVPVPLIDSLWGRNQSIIVTLVDESGPTTGSAGICCMVNYDNASSSTGDVDYYWLRFFNTTYQLLRIVGVTTTVLIAAQARGALPIIWEFRATINPADVTLDILQNDVITDTLVDADASRLSVGTIALYGEEIMSGGVASQHGFRNFTGRRL